MSDLSSEYLNYLIEKIADIAGYIKIFLRKRDQMVPTQIGQLLMLSPLAVSFPYNARQKEANC